jgi:hypothetical protein
MTMPPDDAMTKAYPVHRLEVFTGAETVSAVARRHGLASTQLFTWRREARAPLPEAGVMFAPVTLIDPPPEPSEAPKAPKASAVRRKVNSWVEAVRLIPTMPLGHSGEVKWNLSLFLNISPLFCGVNK